MSRVVIVGAGAAGMAAAIAAAGAGHEVCVYEKNEKAGKKLFITGKGRCNLTNACSEDEFFQSIVTNSKFMFSSFKEFNNQDIMELLESCGCRIKTERGNRVFPASDKSSDVIRSLEKRMQELGVTLQLFSEAEGIWIEDNECRGIILKKGGRKISADYVIITCGGLSYSSTGSTGDGYRFARSAGHTITPPIPALVPLNIREEWIKELQGLALKNVRVSVYDGDKLLYSEFGEMLFTHFGVSGPVILSASSYTARILKEKELILSVDLKPALSREQLDARILREFETAKNKQYGNALVHLYPGKLLPVMIRKIGIPSEKKVNEITKEERGWIIENTKNFTMTIISTRDYDEAIITQGGVNVKEINPKTMESKKVKNLKFAGEVLDADAVTGGYNLQIAWSTGWAAGSTIEW